MVYLHTNITSGPPTVNTETMHTSLLDNLTTAVVVLDEKLCLFHINPAAEALLEISDRRSHHLFLGEVLANADELVDSLKNVQRNRHTFIARKAELVLHNHHRIIVDYSVSPVNEIGPDFLLLEIQSHDRSWRISKKEALLSTHQTTQELVRGLGHEIKNPLGGIRGAAQLLSLELPDDALRDYTNIIIEETDRLVNLVDRLTGTYQKPDIAMINIHEVVERVRNLVQAECRGEINIVRDYDPSIPELEADSEQLIQAVLNIVRNAMQALSEAKDHIDNPTITLKTRAVSHVTIGSELHKLAVRIKIMDNGPGIKPEILDNIFYPLISGRADGSGLGLSIAQTIVKNHGGLIECESQPGATSFIVTIPILKEGSEA